MASSVCLALISGIPASGKTTLADIIVEFVHSIPFDLQVGEEKGRLEVIHIPFDDVIPNDIQLEEESNSSTWRQWRRMIVSYLDDLLNSLLTKQLPLLEGYKYMQNKYGIIEGQIEEEKIVFNNLQKVLLRQLKSASSTVNKKPLATLFILDDNFFYRSMRYEYFQLARKHILLFTLEEVLEVQHSIVVGDRFLRLICDYSFKRAAAGLWYSTITNVAYPHFLPKFNRLFSSDSTGFCNINISCPYEVASCRNSQRSSPISQETYVNMMAKMEEPNVSKASWERCSLLVDGETEFNHLQLSQIWGLIQYALQNPVPPIPEEDEEGKELSRAISQTSVLHQADQILRKCVSESMLKAKDNAEGTCDLKSFASKVNQARTSLLDGIREGSIRLPPLTVAGGNKEENVKNEEFETALQKHFHNSVNS